MIKEINNIKETHTLCNEAKMIFAGNSRYNSYWILLVRTFKQSFNCSLNISIEVFNNADFENAGMK